MTLFTLNNNACFKTFFAFCFVESNFILNLLLFFLIIESVVTPIEPVEPKTIIFFLIIYL